MNVATPVPRERLEVTLETTTGVLDVAAEVSAAEDGAAEDGAAEDGAAVEEAGLLKATGVGRNRPPVVVICSVVVVSIEWIVDCTLPPPALQAGNPMAVMKDDSAKTRKSGPASSGIAN